MLIFPNENLDMISRETDTCCPVASWIMVGLIIQTCDVCVCDSKNIGFVFCWMRITWMRLSGRCLEPG